MDCILFIWFLDTGKYKLKQIIVVNVMQITFALIPVPECPA